MNWRLNLMLWIEAYGLLLPKQWFYRRLFDGAERQMLLDYMKGR